MEIFFGKVGDHKVFFSKRWETKKEREENWAHLKGREEKTESEEDSLVGNKGKIIEKRSWGGLGRVWNNL